MRLSVPWLGAGHIHTLAYESPMVNVSYPKQGWLTVTYGLCLSHHQGDFLVTVSSQSLALNTQSH